MGRCRRCCGPIPRLAVTSPSTLHLQVVVFDYPPKRIPLAVRLLRAAMPDPLDDSSSSAGGGAGGGASVLGSGGGATVFSGVLAWALASVEGLLLGSGGGAYSAGAASAAAGAAAVTAQGSLAGLAVTGGGQAVSSLHAALTGVLGTAAMLDGQVAAYSPEADLLARARL